MDYTTLTLVKEAMQSTETVQDPVLSTFITRASRYLDKLCTSQNNVSNYFATETITDEILTNGVINYRGDLTIFPHKPAVNSVSALSYRYSLRDSWQTANVDWLSLQQEMVVFEGALSYSEQVYAKISYIGGLGATVADLPADLVDVATVMTIRLYKEARSGLGDTIGVAELGELVYTKAFPQRVLEMLNIANYARTAPWT